MWDKYRYNSEYVWVDERIRAQAGGIAVNAHAGAVTDLSVSGLRGFAQAIRKNIEYELRANFDMQLPEPKLFDEVVLRTLIREYGARSYQFSLTHKDDNLLRLHTCFGVSQEGSGPDALAHHRMFFGWNNDLAQMRFLLGNLEARDHADDQLGQTTLFPGFEGPPDSQPNRRDQFYAYD
jgi:hypothetical protein